MVKTKEPLLALVKNDDNRKRRKKSTFKNLGSAIGLAQILNKKRGSDASSLSGRFAKDSPKHNRNSEIANALSGRSGGEGAIAHMNSRSSLGTGR